MNLGMKLLLNDIVGIGTSIVLEVLLVFCYASEHFNNCLCIVESLKF